MFKNCIVPEMLEQIFCLIVIRWHFFTPTLLSASIWHFGYFSGRYYRGVCSKDTIRELVHVWKRSWKSKISPQCGIWLPSCSQSSTGIRVVTHVFWWVDALLQFLLPCQTSLLNTSATQPRSGPLIWESLRDFNFAVSSPCSQQARWFSSTTW